MLMRRSTAVFAFAFFFVSQWSQAGEEKCFCWKVTKDGNVAYVMGSIHLATPDMYPLPDEMLAAFESSKALAVEADIEKMNQAEVQMMVLKKGMYSGEDLLSKKLSKPTKEALDKYLEKNGGTAAVFEKMKPWMVGLALSMMKIQQLGFQEKLGIDKHFLDKARDKKKILELESASFQIDMLSGFNDDQQDKFLGYTLLEIENMDAQMKKMVKAWKSGDAAGLHETMTESNKKYPESESFMKAMIDDRNVKMVEKVEGYMKSGEQTFVVAGALHMTGEKGIVNMLKQKGYTVEQLTVKKLEPVGK